MDDLNVMAIDAVRVATEAGGDHVKIRAIAKLRQADGLARNLHDYKEAVERVLAGPPGAADLPDGSIVAADDIAYIKNHPTATEQWRGTNGSYTGDWRIDECLAAGGQILRVGSGQNGTDR